MRFPSFEMNLQFKFGLFLLTGITLWLLNFPMLYYHIEAMNQRIINLERVEDLYNKILEMRRYEKNFFLYRNAESLTETGSYLDQVTALLEGGALRPGDPESGNRQARLAEKINTYRGLLRRLPASLGSQGTEEKVENELRASGKATVDLAEELIRKERRDVTLAAKHAWRWPMIFMGLIFLIFITGAMMLVRKVVQPLVRLEKATEKIARGDFTTIPHHGRMESEVDRLIIAFNRMVRELEVWQEQSIHARKIASLGTLVSGIAHELNNPINNIVLTVDTLVGGKSLSSDKRAVLLEDILKQALRASTIVKGLLDFSRAETAVLQELDLTLVLRETIKVAANQIALAKVRLHEEIDPDLPPIIGNRQGLHQVFLNLVVNAVQAMPAGGDLTIRAGLAPGPRIFIEFHDTGVGIAEENLPNIFDPFFTTKEVGKGTGLGLSVSHGVIQKHGGQISVSSKLGKGTTFRIEIPLRPRDRNA